MEKHVRTQFTSAEEDTEREDSSIVQSSEEQFEPSITNYQKIVKNMKNKKAPGPSDICTELLKEESDEIN